MRAARTSSSTLLIVIKKRKSLKGLKSLMKYASIPSGLARPGASFVRGYVKKKQSRKSDSFPTRLDWCSKGLV